MEDNNKEELKMHVLDRIVRVTHRIQVIEAMINVIQNREYQLHFCFDDQAAFAGEAERIENDLLRGYEKHVIGKLKHRLHEEQKRLDSYDRLLTEKNKNKK